MDNDEKSAVSSGDFEKMLNDDSQFRQLFAEAVFNVRTCFESLFQTNEFRNFRQPHEEQQVNQEGINTASDIPSTSVEKDDEKSSEEALNNSFDRRNVMIKTEVIEQEEHPYKCAKCGMLFASEHTLEDHVNYNHPDTRITKRHKCDFCSYATNKIGNYKSHLRTHTLDKPFECPRCPKKFSQKGNLNRHLRYHDQAPFECNQCYKNFPELQLLERHRRSAHDKLKPYVCEICSATFGQSSNYKNHLLTHTGVREHSCPYCGKKFKTTSHLRRHERIHTGEKPYKCNQCTAAFNDLSILHRHVVGRHTKDFPHKCIACQKGFTTPSILKRHFARCGKKKQLQ